MLVLLKNNWWVHHDWGTNDDGISKGLGHLVKLINPITKVVVVAPDSPQSAQSHAITINKPITCEKIDVDDGKQIDLFSGTPVDCVKHTAKYEQKTRFMYFWNQHGSNASVNVIYSGTVSAAVKLLSMESLFRFFNFRLFWNAELKHTDNFILHLVRKMLDKKTNVCLNVNIPKFSDKPINGIKIAKQAKEKWIEDFDERFSPMEKDISGLQVILLMRALDADQIYWIKIHFCVPVKHDHTDYSKLDLVNNMLND